MPTNMNSDRPEHEVEVRETALLNDEEARRKFWADKVKTEKNRLDLIPDLIETEFRRVNEGVEITDDIREKINRDSRRAHEALYGCCLVLVAVPDKGDDVGTIHRWDPNRWGELCVRMDRITFGEYYELQYVKPEHLDIVANEKSSGEMDAESNYLVFFHFTSKGGEFIRFQFVLEKSHIDEVEQMPSERKKLQEAMDVRDVSSNRLNTKQQEEEHYLLEDRERLASGGWQIEYCLHGYPLHQDWCGIEQFLKLFWNKYVEQEDAVTLEKCFQSAIDVTSTPYARMWDETNDMQLAISIMLHNGTQDIRNGYLTNARAIAAVTNLFEQWIAISSNSQYDWRWNKIHELYNADEHTLVSYFRNRIPCSCLDDRHKQVRSMNKMGICCNLRCGLPHRKLERSAMESCEQCRLVHYCSRNCQKKDWKRHKLTCIGFDSNVLNLCHAHRAQPESAYDDACSASFRLQKQLRQVKNTIPADNETVQPATNYEVEVIPAQAAQRSTKEIEAEIKRLEREITVSEARIEEALKELNIALTPKVDYWK